MNELLEYYAQLANSLVDDPFLSLANAVAWLDPFWNMPKEYEYEEGNDVDMALYVTRDAFPGIYAQAVEQIRSGTTYQELDNLITEQINRCGIPLDSLEWLSFGIPLPAQGVDLDEPTLYVERPDLVPILALFGIQPEPGVHSVEIPDCAYTAGRLLVQSLTQQTDEYWHQVGWTLAWLFSCSGNSLLDCTADALDEMTPLSWDAESVAFAFEILEEAEGLWRDVDAGLVLLQTNPEALNALTQNVQYVYHRLANRKDKHHEPSLRLQWRPLGGSPDRAALPDPELL